MRLFLAIELDAPLRHYLAQCQDRLRPLAGNAGFTRAENLHLTLKFLGETPEPQLPALLDALKNIPRVGPIPLTLGSLVCFPPHGPVRIIGTGLTENPPPLLALVQSLEDICFDLGFPREARAYKAHITLARAHRPLPTSLRPAISRSCPPDPSPPAMLARQIVVMESQLGQGGTRYIPMARFDITLL